MGVFGQAQGREHVFPQPPKVFGEPPQVQLEVAYPLVPETKLLHEMFDVFQSRVCRLRFGLGSLERVSIVEKGKRGGLLLDGWDSLTQRHVVVVLYRYILGFLDVVDALQNSKAMADTADAHLLQVFVQERHQGLADDVVLWGERRSAGRKDWMAEGHYKPINLSEYCCKPMVAMKSAHSSTVHSEMMVSGSLSPLVR